MNSHEDLTASMLGRVDVSLQAFQSIGFQRAQTTKIIKRLTQLVPSGRGRALRDSLIQGITLLIKLNSFLKQINTERQWCFLHIIIVDGEDSGSRSTLEQAIQIMEAIKKRISVANIQTVFVGFGINNYQAQDLRILTQYGGQFTKYYTVQSHDLLRFIQGLADETGIKRRARKFGIINESESDAFMASRVEERKFNIEDQNFAVLFNLSISSSMNGAKWTSIVNSVELFRRMMGPTDVFATMVFNDKVKLLRSSRRKQQQQMIQQNSSYNLNNRRAPPQQNVVNANNGVVESSNNECSCGKFCCILFFKLIVIIIIILIATR